MSGTSTELMKSERAQDEAAAGRALTRKTFPPVDEGLGLAARTAWLSAILALFICLTLAGALPHLRTLHRGDELNFVETALRFGSGTTEPFGLRHGTGLPMVLFGEYGVWYLLARVQGQMRTQTDMAIAYLNDPWMFVLIGRLTVMVAGVGVIVLTYQIGRKLFSAAAGLVAGAFTGLSLGVIVVAVQIRDDLPATLLLLVSFLFSWQLAGGSQSLRHPMRVVGKAGLALGLASAIKYTAVLGCLFVALGCVWSARTQQDGHVGIAWKSVVGRWLVGALAAVGGFLLLTPTAVLQPALFTKGVHELTFGFTEFPQATPPLLVHVLMQLPANVGVLLAMLMGIGALIVWRLAPTKAAFLLTYPVALLALLSPYVGAPYHLIPALPFLAILAAGGLAIVFERAIRHRTAVRMALIAGALLVLAPSATDACRFVALLQRPDTRLLAREWINGHLPAGAHVLVEGARYGEMLLGVDLPSHEAGAREDLEAVLQAGGRGELARLRLKWAQEHPQPGGFRLTKVLTATPELLEQTGAAYVVTLGYFDPDLFSREPVGVIEPLPCQKPGFLVERQATRRRLERDYAPLARFDPGVPFHETFPLLFLGDFARLRQVPLAGDRSSLSQGPLVQVYERRDGATNTGSASE